MINNVFFKPLLTRQNLIKLFFISLVTFSLISCENTGDTNSQTSDEFTNLEELGQKLYFDENLSNPVGQSCASCHLPSAGFSDPNSTSPVSAGAVSGRVGNRNSPTASYAAFIPAFSFNNGDNRFEGGQFWDGRVDTLEEQAQGPFLNVLEMNNTKQAVIDAIRDSDYAAEFQEQYGADIFDDVDTAYINVSEAIAAFERSSFVSPFTSKFDAMERGDYTFTDSEQRGMAIFNDRDRGDCRRCHSNGNNNQVFSDFSYRNIGVPRNEDNPFYDLDASLNPDGNLFTDLGLGGVLNDANENGKFKVPTLRNVGLTAPYMHNGVFDTLEDVVDFYNRRDLDGVVAEVAANIDDVREMGELGLSQNDIDDLVAFLNTLNDGFSN